MKTSPNLLRSARLAAMAALACTLWACAPVEKAEPVPMTDAESSMPTGVFGFLLTGAPTGDQDWTNAELAPARDADLVVFMEEDCTLCSAALEQARRLSATHRILVAPVEFTRPKTANKFERDLHIVASLIWWDNAKAFELTGATGQPHWIGVDSCGKQVLITGLLLEADIVAIRGCSG